MNGAVSHAFNDVIFKGLLLMSMGAVLHQTGKINGSELGGLYKSMPQTTGLCIVGAASISAFPLFSGFVSKSMVMSAAAAEGYWIVWILLLFASAGVFHHAGIKIPYFAFFAHDSGIRTREPPLNMRIAMAMAAILCVVIGCYPAWLYSLLPWEVGYVPYTGSHVLVQVQAPVLLGPGLRLPQPGRALPARAALGEHRQRLALPAPRAGGGAPGRRHRGRAGGVRPRTVRARPGSPVLCARPAAQAGRRAGAHLAHRRRRALDPGAAWRLPGHLLRLAAPSAGAAGGIAAMKMNGEFRVPTDRETVWRALNDPEVLKECLPGCREIEKTSDTEMTATLVLKVGPVKATFAGGVTLSDLDPPNGYTLSGQGQGGTAGFASGEARVRLVDEGGETVVQYDVDAKVGGKLAQIGSRLIDSTAKKLARQFFDSLAEKLGGGEEAEAELQPEAAAPAPPEAPAEPAAPAAERPAEDPPAADTPAADAGPPLAPAAKRMGLPTAAWAAAVVAVAVVLILVFTGVI